MLKKTPQSALVPGQVLGKKGRKQKVENISFRTIFVIYGKTETI